MSGACVMRPTIKLVVGEIERVVDESEAALIEAKRGLYVRGDSIVTVGDTKLITPNGETTVRRIFECGDYALLEHLGVAARFEKFDGRSGSFIESAPPMAVVKTLKQRRGSFNFPVLSALIDAPTIRADGTLLDRPGYDRATGLLYEATQNTFPPVPNRPSRDAAAKAAEALLELVGGFPFVDEASRSVALAGMLTAVTRRAFNTAPMFAYTAPVAGSGKSYLVDINSILATGREAAVIAQGKKDEETEKRLGALLREGSALVAIDNCEAPVGGDFLCQLLTQPSVRVRILGLSEVPELPTNALVCATGNNLRLAGDMTRRALLCSLDPKVERPELRTFPFDPVDMVKRNRGRYVCASLTMIRAFIAAGRPRQADPIGSFIDWSRMIRDTLLWLGFTDPIVTMEQARACDPELENLNAVMEQWRREFGDERKKVADVIRRATEKAPFPETAEFVAADLRESLLAVAGNAGSINSRRLGNWLSAHQHRVLYGQRFEQAGVLNGVMTWRLAPNSQDAVGGLGAFRGLAEALPH